MDQNNNPFNQNNNNNQNNNTPNSQNTNNGIYVNQEIQKSTSIPVPSQRPGIMQDFQRPIDNINTQTAPNCRTQPIQQTKPTLNNNPAKKKVNIGIIAGIIIAVATIGIVGILVVPKLLPNNPGNNENIENISNNKISGDIELIKEYEKGLYEKGLEKIENSPYLTYAHENKKWVLDKNGKELFEINDFNTFKDISYIGDGFFELSGLFGDHFQIIDTQGDKQEFSHTSLQYESSIYKDGVLYYAYPKENDAYEETPIAQLTTVAYDLNNKEVLWEIDGYRPFILKNGYVLARKGIDDISRLIIDKADGSIIDTANGGKIYATESAIYVVNDKTIDIYDYENNKKGSFTLEETDSHISTLETVLNTGGFVTKTYSQNDYNNTPIMYTVYDINGEEIFSFNAYEISSDGIYESVFSDSNTAKQSSPEYAILTAKMRYDDYTPKVYIVFDDNSHIELYDAQVCGDFVFGYTSADSDTVRGVNLITKEEKILDGNLSLSDSYLDKAIETCTNSSYFVINTVSSDTENKNIVYDKALNKIYASENTISPLNDDYFLEIDDGSDESQSKIYLINVKTLEKKSLETEGVYDFNTTNNLVTRDSSRTKQRLYLLK